ncbi:hypothetical protein [Streptomyces sp. NPDC001435]|uniref:hypothetical protein n=1 Tax=Streptomyces sp. NPDC001435 TaxID=3364576 RepID=UPI00368985FA
MEYEVADRRRASSLGREAQVAEADFEGVRGHGLSGPSAREEPSGARIGCGHGVRPLAQVVQQHAGEGLRDGRRRVAEPDLDLAVLTEDIVGGEPCDPGERLRVEEDEHGGHAVLDRDVVAVDGLPEQGEPLVLSERGWVAGAAVRNGDRGHVVGPHRPSQKGMGEAPGGVAACVPVVDIGLRAVGEGSPALGEVSEEGGREVDLVAGLVDLLAGERAAVGQGVQAALDVPGGEELQQAPMTGAVDGGQSLGKPTLEQQQLPVGRGRTPLCKSRSRR